jgi:hypothetical protein
MPHGPNSLSHRGVPAISDRRTKASTIVKHVCLRVPVWNPAIYDPTLLTGEKPEGAAVVELLPVQGTPVVCAGLLHINAIVVALRWRTIFVVFGPAESSEEEDAFRRLGNPLDLQGL